MAAVVAKVGQGTTKSKISASRCLDAEGLDAVTALRQTRILVHTSTGRCKPVARLAPERPSHVPEQHLPAAVDCRRAAERAGLGQSRSLNVI